MTSVLISPDVLPLALADLTAEVSSRLPGDGHARQVKTVGPDRLADTAGVWVMVVDESGQSEVGEAVANAIADALEGDASDVIAVVGDSYLGSDAASLAPARIGAGVVAAVRSKATRRGARRRANVVCIPAALVSNPASPRGPLAHETDVTDIAEAILFFADPSNSYVNGQVLHLNGGRHIFSSLTA